MRRELGPSYDAALVDSFAERIERAIAERVEDQLARRREVAAGGRRSGRPPAGAGRSSRWSPAIPISIVLGVDRTTSPRCSSPGSGIVLVNMAARAAGPSPALI